MCCGCDVEGILATEVKMKIRVTTKLLGTHIELRSYELDKTPLKVILCVSTDYKNCYHEGEGYMTLTINAQQKGKIVNTQRSQFYPYAYYRMVSFLWKPKGKIQERQLEGKQIEFRGNVAIIK